MELHEFPLQLAARHRALETGNQLEIRIPRACESVDLLDAIVHGAGFSITDRTSHPGQISCRLRREHSLSDTIAPEMRLLLCGLNPSPASASSGVGFHKPGNRFWPALMASGLVTRDRDPLHALGVHRIGMTDLVKRTTSKASMIEPDEFAAGVARLALITDWLAPQAICFVGLAGWRAAIDSKATSGWQSLEHFGCPTYLMPSTSGLNASSSLSDLTNHFNIVASEIV